MGQASMEAYGWSMEGQTNGQTEGWVIVWEDRQIYGKADGRTNMYNYWIRYI